jgi:hypothetical protein
MCRTLAQRFPEPDANTLRKQLLKHGEYLPSESLGLVRGLGPHWTAAESSFPWYRGVVDHECAARERRGRDLHPPADAITAVDCPSPATLWGRTR